MCVSALIINLDNTILNVALPTLVRMWCRRSPKVTEVLPLLYLHGLSTKDFVPALEEFFGSSAGLSASAVGRLTVAWQAEHETFMNRSLVDRDFVYVWVDGVHFNVRLEEARLCALVVVGVRQDGHKELVAIAEGHRESADAWEAMLRDLGHRGMKAPMVAVGDGALGFWKALRLVFPETREQRDWFHKAANVLLHASSSELQWIVDSYAMVFAGLLLVGGSLADRFGRKRIFLIGLTVFAVGSIGAALSGSVDLLITWRAVMGAGAALTIPSSLSILNDVFRDPKERARAIGIWGGTIGLGIAIGPIAGGLLLANFWWGSVFLVNVPIAVAGFVGALVLVPDSKNPLAARPDPAGAVLSVAGLGLLLWAIIEAPTRAGLRRGARGRTRKPCRPRHLSSPGKLAVTTRC